MTSFADACRYSRLADWDYIERCAAMCTEMPLIGNGDVVSFTDWNSRMQSRQLASGMIARGALIKPWIFKEVRPTFPSPFSCPLAEPMSGPNLSQWQACTI